MKRIAVIVAGGRGLRMGGELPKQFLPLAGKPLLMHTIERFYAFDAAMQIILVLPSSQMNLWDDLCRTHHFVVPCSVVAGGTERFFSVKNGLQSIDKCACADALVAVHDGVRPFVSDELLERCFGEAEKHGAVIPVVDVLDTLRYLPHEGESETVDRSRYRLVQTPQVFTLSLLQKAYAQPFSTTFTDDASVVEAMGKRVALVAGCRENIKITTPFDMEVAKALLPCST